MLTEQCRRQLVDSAAGLRSVFRDGVTGFVVSRLVESESDRAADDVYDHVFGKNGDEGQESFVSRHQPDRREEQPGAKHEVPLVITKKTPTIESR